MLLDMKIRCFISQTSALFKIKPKETDIFHLFRTLQKRIENSVKHVRELMGKSHSLFFLQKLHLTLRDLVPFVQFKKREKHPWRSVNFSKVAGFSLQLY